MTGRIPSRIALILGGALFACSFFLPLGYHSPREELLAAADAVAMSASIGEGAFPAGEVVVVAYPYVWALLVVATALWHFSGKRRSWTWLHVAVNSVGNFTLMAMCILRLLVHDPWLSAKLPGPVVILPAVILLAIWGAARFAPPARREWVVVSVGWVPQLLLQIMLVFISLEGAGQAHGFVTGGIGALLALAGAIGSAGFEPRSPATDAVAAH